MNNDVNEQNEQNNNLEQNNVNNEALNNIEELNTAIENTPPIKEEVDNAYVSDNILEEKKGNKVILIILGILIVFLVMIAIYVFFFKDKKELTAKEVYFKGFDAVSNYVMKDLNATEDILKDTIKVKHDIKVSLNTEDPELATISSLLKKSNLILETNVDGSKNYSEIGALLNYDNAEVLNAKLMLNDKDLYINLGSLYEKNIKTEIIDNSETPKLNDISKSVNNITSIVINKFKGQLKDEWFTQTKEELNKESVTKYTLTINNFNEYYNKIVKDIQNDQTLYSNIKNIMNVSEDDVKEFLDKFMLDETDSNEKLVINTYLTKKNEVKKIVVMMNDEERINITKEGEKYLINVSIDDKMEQIGNFKVEKNYFEFNSNYDGLVINVVLDKKDNNNKKLDLGFKMVCKEDDEYCQAGEIKLSLNNSDKNGNLNVTVNIPSLDLEASLEDKFEILKGANIELPDFNNSIDMDKFDETEMGILQSNLVKNTGLLTLLSDLGLMAADEIDDLLETACFSTNNGKDNFSETVDNYLVECRNGACRVTNTLTNEMKTLVCENEIAN